eukprot:1161719-Pelagomonas_calceolata.AAC.13
MVAVFSHRTRVYKQPHAIVSGAICKGAARTDQHWVTGILAAWHTSARPKPQHMPHRNYMLFHTEQELTAPAQGS